MTWLKLDVQEIVIVDWSSDEHVSTTLSDIQDPRIRIIRVENEQKWILTYGFNVGLRFASYSKIYKLDADIQVSPGFIEQNQFEKNEFIRGSWKLAIEKKSDDQKFVNGSFGANKKDLQEIGFYNEFIRSYGWDDSDLYHRLASKQGLRRKFLAYDSLLHLEQEQEERLKHQDVSKNDFVDRLPATEFMNLCNKFTVALFDKWEKNLLQDYSINCLNERLWTCQRTSKDEKVPDFVRQNAEHHAVIEIFSWISAALAQKLYNDPWMAKFIYHQYKKGTPFEETASIILFEENFDIVFCEGSNPYGVLKTIRSNFIGKEPSNSRQLFIFEGADTRFELQLNGEKTVFQGLKHSVFSKVKQLHEHHKCLKSFPRMEMARTSTASINRLELNRTLAISLYDEDNKNRVKEYLECLQRNMQHFDAVAIFYEKSSGSTYDLVSDLINTQNAKTRAEIIWINTINRPTFEDIFSAVDFIFPGTLAFIANADIVFDETIYTVNETIADDSFFVLSRKEVDPINGADDGLVMNNFDMPNTLSADAWIYLTPRKMNFRADFPIGTFHCDSFLNYHIHQSGYRLYNPCLSVNAFHVHDPAFNSSETKKSVHARQIDEILIKETALCGGESPIKGVHWCRIEDTADPTRAGSLVAWSDFIINIEIDSECINFFPSLITAIVCLKISNHISGNVSISLSLPSELACTEFGHLLFDTVFEIGSKNLNVAVTNPSGNKPFTQGSANHIKTSPDARSLINTYLACHTEGNDNSLFGTNYTIKDTGDGLSTGEYTYGLISFDKTQLNDLTTYLLLKCLKPTEADLLLRTIASLSRNYPALQPMVDEMNVAAADSVPTVLLNGLWDSVVAEKPRKYDISFVTSIFKGEEYIKGFLENIAASVLECNGEVILIDANSPENEKSIFDAFINEFPGLQTRITYISLSEDPGLYNCWKLAIEKSSSDFISNANLDDRRSPWQSKVLVDTVRRNPRIAGAATAIRATRSKNAGWYNLTENELWFKTETSNSIRFESLYLTNENNQVYSKNIMHCMPVWKKSLHSKYGYFDEERYGTSADWGFWLKCTKSGEVFELVPSALSMYFINESSHNRVKDTEGAKELLIISDFISDKPQEFIQQ